MTDAELKKLADELAVAREKWEADFDKWYDNASMSRVEYHCLTGYLVSRLITEGPSE